MSQGYFAEKQHFKQAIMAVLRYSLPVLKIYSLCHIYYRFSVLAVNIGTQPRYKTILSTYFISKGIK